MSGRSMDRVMRPPDRRSISRARSVENRDLPARAFITIEKVQPANRANSVGSGRPD